MGEATVILKKGEGRTLKSGGLWLYDNEIASVQGDFENGDIISVHDFDGYFLGYGFINTRSRIAVRLLSRKKETLLAGEGAERRVEEFIAMRVKDAWEYRKQTVDTSCCRLLFGEADFLPGIIVDKFSDVLVVESLALGIDRLKPVILEAFRRILAKDGITVRGVYERSDAKVREKEGMERRKGFLATCSCSHFMDPELFAKTIKEAAKGARKRLRQVQFGTQACDHPILWAAEESYYLKFYIFQVVEEK